MLTVLDPLVPRVISLPFVTATVLLLPGFFGFLVWELKENWKLFAANRPQTARPVLIGHHGETLRVMLRRGFHAGTVPKAFDRLRRLLSKARDSGFTPRVKLRKAEAQLLRTRHEIARLQERELLASLQCAHRDGDLGSFARVNCDGQYMATASVEMSLLLPMRRQDGSKDERIIHLTLYFMVSEGELRGRTKVSGPLAQTKRSERQRIADEIADFFARCDARYHRQQLERVLLLDDTVPGAEHGERRHHPRRQQ
jgi:hypothetical protein